MDQTKQHNGGFRKDGTPKGQGWLGPLQRPDGKISTEITVGIPIGGKEMDIPTLVPTLDKDEINYLLNTEPRDIVWDNPMGQKIMMKAYQHAEERLLQNMSPFKD